MNEELPKEEGERRPQAVARWVPSEEVLAFDRRCQEPEDLAVLVYEAMAMVRSAHLVLDRKSKA